jgi:RNA polymerase sigma-70 factor (ECF subfamily)
MVPLSPSLHASWEIEESSRVADSKSTAGVAIPFDEFYERYVRFVWRTLRGMGIPKALVADAAQDVFVVVHKKLPAYEGTLGHKTWLFRIVYRVVCDYRRKMRRAASQEPLDHAFDVSAPGPTDPQARHEAVSLLADLLARLDEDKRVVLFLAEVEEMTAPEIAAATGTPLNTVYTRLRRARTELNAAFAAHRRRDP